MGASDFVQVPFDVNILNYRVSNAVKRTWFAFYENDVLTGLFKKERFEKETALMLRKHLDKQFAFVTLDIDGFKTYNSFFGVKKGDELMIRVIERMQEIDKRYQCVITLENSFVAE